MSSDKPVLYVAIKEFRNLVGFIKPQDAVDFIASVEATPEYGPEGERLMFEYTIMMPDQVDYKGLTCLGPAGPASLKPVKGGKK